MPLFPAPELQLFRHSAKVWVVDIMLKSESIVGTNPSVRPLFLCCAYVCFEAKTFKGFSNYGLRLLQIASSKCTCGSLRIPRTSQNLGLLNAEANFVNSPQPTIHWMPV